MKNWSLVVEPDRARAEQYVGLLEGEGLEVTVTRDGEAALALLGERGAPRLLLTELAVPKRDGFEVIEATRKASRDCSVVVVSAFRELRDTAARSPELGIGALLAKTLPLPSIQKAVRKALGGEAVPVDEVSAPELSALRDAEVARLERLATSGVLEEGPDEALQALVTETARAFKVPIALVSLVLGDRQWFKSHVGLTGALAKDPSTPLDASFCRHVVDAKEPLVVADAATHPYFMKTALVRDGSLRSYAGAPLLTPEGVVLGTLCIIDNAPRGISAEDVQSLVVLARRVAGHLMLREQERRAGRTAARLAHQFKEEPARSMTVAESLLNLETVFAHMESGVILLDGSAEHRVVLVNDAVLGLFEVAHEDELIGLTRPELLARLSSQATDRAQFLENLAAPEGPYVLRVDVRVGVSQPRTLRWSSKPVPLMGDAGQLTIIRDITAELSLAAEREALARTDHLTGIANRRAGEETLGREVARAQRQKSPLSLVLFDIDHFKSVNDNHGHPVGDALLQKVSRLIQESLRETDLVARWGGEEFLVILPGSDEAGARVFAERVRARVEALQSESVPRVTVSGGVAQWQPGRLMMQTLKDTDRRLYEAKSAGRNRIG